MTTGDDVFRIVLDCYCDYVEATLSKVFLEGFREVGFSGLELDFVEFISGSVLTREPVVVESECGEGSSGKVGDCDE